MFPSSLIFINDLHHISASVIVSLKETDLSLTLDVRLVICWIVTDLSWIFFTLLFVCFLGNT